MLFGRSVWEWFVGQAGEGRAKRQGEQSGDTYSSAVEVVEMERIVPRVHSFFFFKIWFL